MEEVLLSVTNVAAGILFGGMLAFTGFLAPMAFSRLPEEHAGPFVQGLFPNYYIIGTAISAIGAFAAITVKQPEAIILWFVAMGFLFSRYYVMPRTVAAYEARDRGEIGAAEKFADLHKRASFINMIQIILLLVVLIRMAG
jgi:hypothetical protein